ncbi:MAG: hypothetical protein H0W85_02245 [Methylotenera sp.]|nr:hypothetical protein [Methylotenera sp.]
MYKSLKIFLAFATILFTSQAIADNNNNSNNSGRISEDNISQSQANPNISYNSEARRNPVSTAFAVAPLPSATCRSGAALGVQGMGFGITGGGDKAVVSCEINEATRIAATVLGDQVTALHIFCQNEYAKVAPACKAIAAHAAANTATLEKHSLNANPLTN